MSVHLGEGYERAILTWCEGRPEEVMVQGIEANELATTVDPKTPQTATPDCSRAQRIH